MDLCTRPTDPDLPRLGASLDRSVEGGEATVLHRVCGVREPGTWHTTLEMLLPASVPLQQVEAAERVVRGILGEISWDTVSMCALADCTHVNAPCSPPWVFEAFLRWSSSARSEFSREVDRALVTAGDVVARVTGTNPLASTLVVHTPWNAWYWSASNLVGYRTRVRAQTQYARCEYVVCDLGHSLHLLPFDLDAIVSLTPEADAERGGALFP